MNERIQKLLKQATKEVNPEDREWVFFRVDQVKFAESIVRECIHTVEHHGGMCGATSGQRLRDRFELND